MRPRPKTPSGDPASPTSAPTIPDHFDEIRLASALSVRLAGTPADGSSAAPTNARAVIWVDHGDEVLVHLDSISIRILDRVVLISIDLETDQRGRTPLVVAFALGNTSDPAGLIAVTDKFPHGDGTIASRWGQILQEALWSSLLGLALDHADERSASPLAISSSVGRLQFHAGPPLSATRVPSPGSRT